MNPTPELDGLFAGIFKPGAVILTTGFKGGGKTHTAIAVSEQLIKGYYPSIPKVEVFTNVIFLHNEGGKIVEGTPEHVHTVTTMKDLFPMLVDSIEKNGRNVLNLLILDEAQNFLGGDSNQTNASVMMKEMLGIIRKFRLVVWLLTPTSRSVGPAFRNWLTDPKYPGNITAKFLKDMEWNERYIAENHLDMDPRSLMQVMNYDSDPFLLEVPITPWTRTWRDLREGEYCYDHEASATFHVGDDFDWELFNRTIGGVSSIRVLDTIRQYYRQHHGEAVEKKPTPEEMRKLTQGEIAKRMFESGASQREVAKTLGISRQTVLKRIEQYGTAPKTQSKFTPKKYLGKQAENPYSEGGQRLPPQGVASKVVNWQLEGGFSPPIYNSSKPPEIRGVSEVGVATSEHDSDDQDGPFETPVPEGRYTLAELRRAVRHCIGDDEDGTED